MDDPEEEEDVIIEGSDLHRALVDLGYTDFELTLARPPVLTQNLPSKEPIEKSNNNWLPMLSNFFKRACSLIGIFNNTPNTCYVCMKQFAMILRVEALIDEHAMVVQSFMDKNAQSLWNTFAEWSSLVASSAMLGITYFMSERTKTLAIFVTTSLIALIICRKYEDAQAVRTLKRLVSVQNELYHSYKKGLAILRRDYRHKVDGKQVETKFSQLEMDRVKYLQPIIESLLKSMENVSRMYYEASSMIVKVLPQTALTADTLTRFEADAFTIEGDITYEKLRQLYYVYVLVQSDMMQLLAIAYNADTWIDHERISHSLLTRIIDQLSRCLINHQNRLTQMFIEYERCKTKISQRKFRATTASKWRDLYLNLDLLSRKVQTAYDMIGSVLDAIDQRQDDETTEDAFVTELAAKTQDICLQIGKAGSFAEFNSLLVAILQRSRRAAENSVSALAENAAEADDERLIIKDCEPEIIDEVFEEYITEEYLKPLYEENDESTAENIKFEKLLAKNFMSELKDALVDKFKSMSEREAKALLRKYQGKTGHPQSEERVTTEVPLKLEVENSTIPPPPPWPSSADEVVPKPRTNLVESRGSKKSRGPVPLPRASAIAQRVPTVVPVPPPLPSELELSEYTERLSIDLSKLGIPKVPAFIASAEEFIGSGENSEDDLENSDLEDNDLLKNATTD